MRNIFALLFSLSLSVLVSQQDLKKNFKPLRSQGTLPELFTKNVSEIVAEEIINLNKTQDSNKAGKSEYITRVNYQVDEQIKSGNSLINEEVTTYINDIVDVLLKDQPDLRKKIHVYVSKTAEVNASTYGIGYVFVDMGIVAQAKNESQLALMLSHEITHYVKQHSIDKILNSEKLEAAANGKNEQDVFLKQCQYSREKESEADLEGFELLRKTNYDLKEVSGLFDILQYSHLPFEMTEFKKSFFETENFKIPATYFLKDVSPIKDNSNEDDSEHTHPNTLKRKLAIENLVSQNAGKQGIKNIHGDERFLYIRDLARFELCRLYLKHRNYGAALYSTYILSQKYPDNLFLAETVSKCLYAISLNHLGYLRYNKDSDLDGPIHYLEVESYPQQLYYLINKMPDSEWNIMALNYTFRKHRQFPDNKIFSSVSDSLFNLMQYANAELETFDDNIKIENVSLYKDTTSWYRNAFADLFSTDKEFREKFPKKIGHEFIMPYTPKSYKVNNYSQKIRKIEKISSIIALSPHYIIFDDKDLQSGYAEATIGQKDMSQALKNCATSQTFQLISLDPESITNTEVNKLNDYSTIKDWIYERIDGYENEKSRVPVFNISETDDLISKYGTSYVLFTRVIVLGKQKAYVFYSIIYDLKKNVWVYINQQFYKSKANKSEIEKRVCELLNDLKNGNITEKE